MSLATLCPHTPGRTLGQGRNTSLQYKRPVDPGWPFLCPFWGLGNHISHHTWAMDSCLPEPAGRRTQGQVRGRLSWGHSDSSMAGRQAGRQADWGRSLWSLANAGAYCRGFSRADPGTSSGVAGGNADRPGPSLTVLPGPLPASPPPISGALGRVLVGGCEASLSLPGHLGGIRPANGTGPVGLQPLVDTLGMELMVAGENSEQLPNLKVTEADHTQRLLRLMTVRVKAV